MQKDTFGFPPKAFIIGAQKSGTTSLAALLSNNPQVCLASPKEPNYYSVNYEKGQEWYRQRFEFQERLLLDASTTYTMCPLTTESLLYKEGRKKLQGVPERIFRDSPDAKLIYIIRDPVKRVVSNYWHNVKYGYEKLPLEEAVKRDKNYLEMSFYFKHIQLYLQYFDEPQLMVIRFEDFVADQLAILNQCEVHFGLTHTKVVEQPKSLNRGARYGTFGNLLLKSKLLNKWHPYAPGSIKRLSKKILTKDIPPIDKDLASELRVVFHEDQRQLYQFCGLSFLE